LYDGAGKRDKRAGERHGYQYGYGTVWHPYRNGTHVYCVRRHADDFAAHLGLDEVERALIVFLAAWHCDPEQQSREALADSAVEWVGSRARSADPELLEAIWNGLVHVKCAGDGPEAEVDLTAARDEVERRRWSILADVELKDRVNSERGWASVALVAERLGTWPVDGRDRMVSLAAHPLARGAFEDALRGEIARVERGFVLGESEALWGVDRRPYAERLTRLLDMHVGLASYEQVVRASLPSGMRQPLFA
jgi:hypothetical protein